MEIEISINIQAKQIHTRADQKVLGLTQKE